MKTVVIGGPIQNRADCVSDYLEHLYNLDYPRDRLIPAFFINNSTDQTEEIVRQFQNEHQDEYRDFLVWSGKVFKGKQDDQTRRSVRDYALFSAVRNTYLKKIKKHSFDYLFSVDSDVLVPPDALTKLVGHDLDVVSGVLYNGRKDGIDYYNVFKYLEGDYRPFLKSYMDTHPLIEVDVTGACYLISRRVLDAGVRYGNYPAGEDGYFCIKAQKLGFKLYADTTVNPIHLLSGKVGTVYRQPNGLKGRMV